MVVDSARIHRSQLVQDFLVKHEDLLLLYLPPYSLNLNPIERLWHWLKKTVIANRFHPTRASIEEAMNIFLDEILIVQKRYYVGLAQPKPRVEKISQFYTEYQD
jgi:transposase